MARAEHIAGANCSTCSRRKSRRPPGGWSWNIAYGQRESTLLIQLGSFLIFAMFSKVVWYPTPAA